MLGPLPRIYRLAVLLSTLLVCTGAAAWLSRSLDFPYGGLLVGSLSGALLAFVAIHDFHRGPDPARIPRRR